MSALRHLTTPDGTPVGRIGYGLMNHTWVPVQTPDEQAFAAIKQAVDAGSNFLNSGEMYGWAPDGTLGLKLLARFYAKFPDYQDKTLLSIKGAVTPQFTADCSLDFLRQSITNINAVLASHGATKKADLFEPGRLDKSRPVEETMRNLILLRDEGHFTHIGLSEVGAATIRRAAAVGEVAAVEIEYSPWTREPERNGIFDACKELGIPLVAFSPLGRGFLSGKLRSRADLPKDDRRLAFDKFSEENFPKNLELVDRLTAFAQAKGCTTTQLVLAWLLAQWDGSLPIPGSTRPAGVQEAAEAAQVKLSADDLVVLKKILDTVPVAGGRYNAQLRPGLDA